MIRVIRSELVRLRSRSTLLAGIGLMVFFALMSTAVVAAWKLNRKKACDQWNPWEHRLTAMKTMVNLPWHGNYSSHPRAGG